MKKLLNWKSAAVIITLVIIAPCAGQAKEVAATKTIQAVFTPAPLYPKTFQAVEFEGVEAGDIYELIEYQGNYMGDATILAPEVEAALVECHQKMTQECGASAPIMKLLFPGSLDRWPREIRTILGGLIGSWNTGLGGILQLCRKEKQIIWNYLPLAPKPDNPGNKETPRKASSVYVSRGFCSPKK